MSWTTLPGSRHWRRFISRTISLAIRTILNVAPQIPQVACFDTAFHRKQSYLAQAFALPRRFADAGVRRYGFHGLSYEFLVARFGELAPTLANARIVIAHLGNGASMCAVKDGRSVATTMGFTAVDGLMMGTRCGAIDPGVILYMMQEHGMDAASDRGPYLPAVRLARRVRHFVGYAGSARFVPNQRQAKRSRCSCIA